ncbi:ABC transporter substrate-binding protein [Georgenia yuyongxinii]|uniref:Extracellular solute-binding protein n=1 Tax=Georgenia yuyongxinii TaxID=2589797 RepID=A0A552WN98_9MICO|nr:extracellular solute-binding protein [Georgenia yuyongxinii]TRW44187.1 extracellular solute-binding protein [Georgenia yuyongxinii]
MKKSLLAATSLGTALALTLAACSGGGNAGDSGTTGGAGGDGAQQITFLTHWGPEQVGMLEDAAAAFTEENPDITVKVQAVPFGNLLSTLRTQGASPDGPTIVGIYDAWLPELVRDGLAAPAPDDVAGEVEANWPESVVGAASQEGAVHGIPNEVDLYQLNYNKAIFDEAGVAEPPADWDALVDASSKISATGPQGIGFITSWNSGAVHPFLSLLASNGGSFLNEDGTASELTSPEAIETAELYQRLVDEGLTDPSKSTANANTTGPYLDNFVNGNTGMIIMANWWEASLQDAMGDGFSDVGTAPIPVGPSGSESSSISYSWMTMVNANAEDATQGAAWEFLSWLNGPDSGEAGSSSMGDILLSMGILPSRNSDIEAHSKELETEFLSSYVAALDTATPFPTVLGGPAATDALQRQIEALLNGQVDAQTAMKKAAADVDAALASAQ